MTQFQDNKPEQSIEQREIHLLVDLLKLRLEHHIALALGRVPDLRRKSLF